MEDKLLKKAVLIKALTGIVLLAYVGYRIYPVSYTHLDVYKRQILERMGDQIKTARLRRNLATELVAERAGISRATLWSVEKGSPTVAIGIYAAVLHALGGMDKDLELVAKDDELGRKLQDLNLVTRKRAKRG